MNFSPRSLLGLVPVVLILGAFWFVVLAPARSEVKATQAQVLEATARRDAAAATAAAAEQARLSYRRDYASVRSLAEAVPPDEDVAALVRGLDSIARANKLDVRTIALNDAVAEEPAPEAAAPPAEGATGGEGGAPAKTDAPAGTAPSAGTEAPAGTAPPAGTDAPAGAVAQAPPGAAVGEAGLLTMPFTFTAEGDYLSLQRFLKGLHARAGNRNGKLRVDGRLLTIDGFSFVAGRKGFPQLTALVSATAYLEPDPGDVIAHSTQRTPAADAAPAAAAPAAPAPGAAG